MPEGIPKAPMEEIMSRHCGLRKPYSLNTCGQGYDIYAHGEGTAA